MLIREEKQSHKGFVNHEFLTLVALVGFVLAPLLQIGLKCYLRTKSLGYGTPLACGGFCFCVLLSIAITGLFCVCVHVVGKTALVHRIMKTEVGQKMTGYFVAGFFVFW